MMDHFNQGDIDSEPKMDMQEMDIHEEKHKKRLDICFENIKHKLYRFYQGLRNEAIAREFISEILLAAVQLSHTYLDAENTIIGDENHGRVDHSIYAKDREFICIAKAKEYKVDERIAMNIMQCQGALQEARRKRKHGENEFDYIYGITTTGKDWRYILLTSENKIYKGIAQVIDLDRDKLGTTDYEVLLKESVAKTVKTIAWMLNSLGNAKTTSKRQHFDSLLNKKVAIKEVV